MVGWRLGAGVCVGGGTFLHPYPDRSSLRVPSVLVIAFRMSDLVFYKSAHTFWVSRMPRTPRVNLSVP